MGRPDSDPAGGLPAGSGCKCIVSDEAVSAELPGALMAETRLVVEHREHRWSLLDGARQPRTHGRCGVPDVLPDGELRTVAAGRLGAAVRTCGPPRTSRSPSPPAEQRPGVHREHAVGVAGGQAAGRDVADRAFEEGPG